MRAKNIVVVTAVGAALALSACSSSSSGSGGGGSTPPSSPPAHQQTNIPVTPPPTTPTTTPSATATAPAAATPITVNKSLTDPVMGDKATILKVVRNFAPTAAAKQKYSALADEEVVLVEVKGTASSKYYDTLGADSFYLVGTDGIDDASTTILDDDIKAAGYPPLADAETGKTTTGWIVFTPDKGRVHLTLRYKRLAAKTSDGTTITAKNFDIPLD